MLIIIDVSLLLLIHWIKLLRLFINLLKVKWHGTRMHWACYQEKFILKFTISYGPKSLFFCRTCLESGAHFFIIFTIDWLRLRNYLSICFYLLVSFFMSLFSVFFFSFLFLFCSPLCILCVVYVLLCFFNIIFLLIKKNDDVNTPQLCHC